MKVVVKKKKKIRMAELVANTVDYWDSNLLELQAIDKKKMKMLDRFDLEDKIDWKVSYLVILEVDKRKMKMSDTSGLEGKID